MSPQVCLPFWRCLSGTFSSLLICDLSSVIFILLAGKRISRCTEGKYEPFYDCRLSKGWRTIFLPSHFNHLRHTLPKLPSEFASHYHDSLLTMCWKSHSSGLTPPHFKRRAETFCNILYLGSLKHIYSQIYFLVKILKSRCTFVVIERTACISQISVYNYVAFLLWDSTIFHLVWVHLLSFPYKFESKPSSG